MTIDKSLILAKNQVSYQNKSINNNNYLYLSLIIKAKWTNLLNTMRKREEISGRNDMWIIEARFYYDDSWVEPRFGNTNPDLKPK